jgi:phosphatidylserine/phosphatidylglycerophosphate/cardiolipin synthase-like enzyme
MKMQKILIITAIAIIGIQVAYPQEKKYGKIKVYFNNPVNTSISTGTNAIYLNQSIDDTLIAYINRTKYSLDVAMYNYSQSSSFSDIAAAVNNAYSRGVTVRWIYDGSSSNSGLSNINPTISRLASPTSDPYGIMHNKFIIMDANSTNENDPIIWTGSCNLTRYQVSSDVNNIVIIQDKNLAQAYTAEFNEMWGDSSATPNTTASKFGPYKTDNTPHSFTIDGKTVELYFSPSDGTNSKILKTINSANTDMYFGIYTYTYSDDANSIKSKINQGVYTAGIIDEYSVTYDPYTILSPVMGNLLQVFTQGSTLYHNKFLIVDPSNPGSDPAVLTGSHNWTISADTKNDENTLIIHDATIANVYLQSFYQNFTNLGGILHLPQGIDNMESSTNNPIHIYPNPFTNVASLEINPEVKINKALFIIFDLLGKPVAKYELNRNYSTTITNENLNMGMYFYKLIDEGKILGCGKICVK